MGFRGRFECLTYNLVLMLFLFSRNKKGDTAKYRPKILFDCISYLFGQAGSDHRLQAGLQFCKIW